MQEPVAGLGQKEVKELDSDLKAIVEVVPEERLCSLIKEFECQELTRFEVIQKVAHTIWEGRQDLDIEGVDEKWDWRMAEKLLNAYCNWHGLNLGIW